MGKLTQSLIFLSFFSFLQVHCLSASTQHLQEASPSESNSTVEWHGDLVSSNTVAVQLLAINEAQNIPSPSLMPHAIDAGKPILAGYLKKVEAKMPGATFFLQAGYHNQFHIPGNSLQTSDSEPSLFTMLGNSHCRPSGGYDRECNFIGLPGNNEFVQGVHEMLQLLYGNQDHQSPYLENSFPSICTNLVETESEHPVFQPYAIRLVDGVPIGFIGALLRSEANEQLVKNKEHLAIREEAASINEYVHTLQGLGVHTIVVMIYQGKHQQDTPSLQDPTKFHSRLQTVLSQLDDEVDVVLSGQSRSYQNSLFQGKSGKKILVVQAWPQEKGVAQIQLQISRASAEVVSMRSTVHSGQQGHNRKKTNVASLNTQGQSPPHQPGQTPSQALPFADSQETM